MATEAQSAKTEIKEMNPPSALHGAMSRERKPFTYTPGGLDLSEIKSERMAKRLMRNAMNQGVPELPPQVLNSPPTPSTPIAVLNYNCLPVQVFPTFNLPANPKSLLRTRSTPDPQRPKPTEIQPSVPPFSSTQFQASNDEPSFSLILPPPSLNTQTSNNQSIFASKLPQPTYNRPSGIESLRDTLITNTVSQDNKIGNSSRPSSLYEYDAGNINNGQTNETSDRKDFCLSPVLPEIRYDAEICHTSQLNSKQDINSSETTSAYETNAQPKNILDFTVKPLSETVSESTPVTKPAEDIAGTCVDEQREVKVVKKQVKKEKKVENGDQNGDESAEAEMTVKLPAKKSAAKTETKVEVVKKVLPDGSIEEVKTTTTKTTIDGRTEIKTQTETTIIPKEEEEEYEEVEEEEVEEEVEENGVEEVEEEPKQEVNTKTVEVKTVTETAVPKETIKIIKQEEKSETTETTTKKVVVVEESNNDEENEEEEEEEIEEEIVESPPAKQQQTPPKEGKVEQEEEEEEEVVEEEEEIDEEKEIQKQKEEAEKVVEVKDTIAETQSLVQENEKSEVEEEVEEEEEYEEAEEPEETPKQSEEQALETTQPKEEQKEKEQTDEKNDKEKEVHIKISVEQESEPKKEESEEPKEMPKTEETKKEEPKPTSAEQKVPLREPSIPLEKVEDVEIKPIGLVSKTHSESTEIKTSLSDKPTGTLSTQTEYNRIENIVTVNRTTKTLDHSYEQLTQQGIPTVKTYFAPDRERVSTSPQPARPYHVVYPPPLPTERRHSLLLERLSTERQMPSDIYQNSYQSSNQTYEQQRQWSQEPQAEVINVSNVKPSTITNQQWYQQSRKENVIYNNVAQTPPTDPAPQSWSQPSPQPQPQAQPQYQPPPQPQPQPQYQSPYLEPTPTYQQNNYSSYSPKSGNWASNNMNSTVNSQTNQYSTESYQKTSQQYLSSYVPPPWEQDPSYVAPEIQYQQPQYQPPPPTTTKLPTSTKPGWKPTPAAGKFPKHGPTSYIPPAPNQSFVKPVNTNVEPPKQPGRKTYYSEYERRYITVPESTYIPTEGKYQPQPDPSPQYYYDSNEQAEPVEPQWRRELREFTEKTSQTQQTIEQTQTSVRPPWEEDPKYAKVPTVTYNPTPSWSQTLRPQSHRERTFESEFVEYKDQWSKTNTLGRGRPLSSYGNSNEGATTERQRGVSVDRYNPSCYKSPVPTEHGPVQTHLHNPTAAPQAKAYHNPNVPAYHARASAEPREQPVIPTPRNWGDQRTTPIQSRSFKYLQWITGTED